MNISLRTGFICLFICGGLLSLYGLWPSISVNTSTEVQVDCGPTKTEVIKSTETVYIQTPAVLEPIILTLVMLGPDIGHEGSIAIKSALMHTSRPLHFHLICTPENIEYMEGKFALFDRPVYPVEVTYYAITPEQVQDRVHRAGIGGNWNLLSKVFIHELLVDIDRAIFIDTDMIFVVDPLELWKNFADFSEDQLMSFPTMGPQSHAGKICSCVMLMDLARMRDVQFMPSTLLPAREALASVPFARGQSEGLQSPVHKGEMEPFDPMNPWFGDQGIYHVVWHFLPERFRDLSQRWDVNFCRQQWGLKLGHWGDDIEEDMTEAELIRSQIRLGGTSQEGKMISPGILHYNCQPGAGNDVWLFEQNHTGGSHFGPMITTTLRYKWAWLNRGDGSATVHTSIKSDVRWWDERLYNAQH